MAALMKWSYEHSGRLMQETLKMLARPAICLLLIAFGCSVDTADLGSNQSGGESGESGEAGSDGGSGAHAGSRATGGAQNGGRAGSAASGTGGMAGRAGADGGGRAGAPNCDCPYPPILGGDCCTVRDACETNGVDCELLRDSILALRAAGRPGRGDSAEDDAYYDCISKLSAALAERCAFVEPECGEPSEDYATFGDPNEEGYSECTDGETRAALRCGEPGSYYAPDCCQRQRCVEDGECASGRCVYRRVQSAHLSPNSYPHVVECILVEAGCSCGGIEAGEPHNGYCIGTDEDIARFDCDVRDKTCSELLEWDEVLLYALASEDESVPVPAEGAQDYAACELKISEEIAERCSPPDCRDAGCEAGFTCQACQGPDKTSWVCIPANSAC